MKLQLKPRLSRGSEAATDASSDANTRAIAVAAVALGTVALVGIALGALGGWVWAHTAPGVRYQIFPNQSWAPLPTETQHRFVAFAILTLIGLTVGVAIAAVAWRFVASRGWWMLLWVAVVASAVSIRAVDFGQQWFPGVDPRTLATAGNSEIVSAPIQLQFPDIHSPGELFTVFSDWPIYLAMPTAAVLTYTLLVAWNGLPTLGRPHPEHRPAPDAAPLTLTP